MPDIMCVDPSNILLGMATDSLHVFLLALRNSNCPTSLTLQSQVGCHRTKGLLLEPARNHHEKGWCMVLVVF